MSRLLRVLNGGPGLSIQDLGRTGYRGQGLSPAGAMDVTALHEGAALLRQPPASAVLEMAGSGGTFRADQDTRVALTGAVMTAQIDGTALAWNASHLLPAGATLTIGGARAGSYGYLHLGGGIATPLFMGSRSTHLVAGIGASGIWVVPCSTATPLWNSATVPITEMTSPTAGAEPGPLPSNQTSTPLNAPPAS